MEVVIPASITPSGFGISQRNMEDPRYSELVTTGSCCGGQVLYTAGSNEQVKCGSCYAIFENTSDPKRNTSHGLDRKDQMVLEWVAHWTGWEPGDLELKRKT